MHILGGVQRVFVLGCRRKEEESFVRLRLLIKTSLCSKVLLPVLMSIKKPKSLCLCVSGGRRSRRVRIHARESTRLSLHRCAGAHVCSLRYCLCARLAQHPGQGEGLILCGLKRINFVLTLAGCGLHPYPPLFSVPGAKQRRRKASRDGEYEGERYHTRKRQREGGGHCF